MKRLVCMAVLPFLIAATPASSPPSRPDTGFLGDFIGMKSSTPDMLRTLHESIKNKSILQQFDYKYDQLADDVNDLFDRVAFDIRNNTPHEAEWKTAADAALHEARTFRDNVNALLSGRRQAYLGLPGTFSVDWKPEQKNLLKNLEVKWEADLSKAQADSTTAEVQKFTAQLQAQAKAASDEQAWRQSFAKDLQSQKWAKRCAIGLAKPACPASAKP